MALIFVFFSSYLSILVKRNIGNRVAERPKLQTVAEVAGVSIATVSQVMRGTGRISDATRKKVLDAANSVSYVTDGRAADMRSGTSREIGLLIHKIANPFNAEVIAGVSDQLEVDGYLVSVLDSRDDPAKQRRNMEALIRNSRGGLLWVPAIDTDEDIFALIEAHQIPVVTFLRRAKKGDFDHVTIENTRATETATNHLADLGHSNIAYVGGRKPVDARLERIAGYKNVLGERKLAEPVIISCEDTKPAGFSIVGNILAEHPQITGIVCNGDMVALGAAAGLQRLGKTPGKDMSIVGFDDIQDSAIATPPLTTMAVAPYEMGRKLARVMLDRINMPEMPATTVLVPAHLTVRETTGAPHRAG
jgi:LacI family transcriptional regulator